MNDSGFKDHFSGVAGNYARFRPVYPEAIYDYVLSFCDKRHTAWDAGTGNGQVAVKLAGYFDKVFASDASKEQIAHATPHPKVQYGVYPAERSPLDDHSIELITVAQALHWFHFEAFWKELRRVAAQGAIFACWTYAHHRVEDSGLQQVLEAFFTEVEDYWPPERDYVQQGYANLPIPFPLIGEKFFPMPYSFTPDSMLSYLRTWSSVQAYESKKGLHPVTLHEENIRKAWQSTGKVEITAIFPLTVKVFTLQ